MVGYSRPGGEVTLYKEDVIVAQHRSIVNNKPHVLVYQSITISLAYTGVSELIR